MDEKDDWHLTDDLQHEQGRGDPFAAAVRATRMPMIITDPNRPDNPIVFANAAFQKLTGYDRDELIGQNCRLLQGPDTDPDKIAELRRAIVAGEDVAVDLLNYRKDGSSFWNALYISPVWDSNGAIQYFFASQLDITSRIDAHLRVARQRDLVEQEVRRRTTDLENALEAQKLLVHEVDHRVKNNMTMIGSILRLQLREMDSASAEQLRKTMQRIDALATVHRRLYQSEDVTRFDIGAFAANLAADLAQTSNVRVLTDLRRAEVPVGHASALGLVVNELLTLIFLNAPAPDKEALLHISARSDEARVLLTLEDEDFGRSAEGLASPPVLSQTIIQRLSAQANATVIQEPTATGRRVTIAIRKNQ